MRDPIDIGGPVAHHPFREDAEVRGADVVTPDDQNVRFFRRRHRLYLFELRSASGFKIVKLRNGFVMYREISIATVAICCLVTIFAVGTLIYPLTVLSLGFASGARVRRVHTILALL